MCSVPQSEAHPASWTAVKEWRKQTRVELLERRVNQDKDERRERGKRAVRHLCDDVSLAAYPLLGIYWPIRGEIDVRGIAREHLAAGGKVALPVVVSKAAPVEFWRWYPGIRMQRGFWNIPIPAIREVLIPDALIIPLVGFDRAGYRLGYGGGYYDRTLAAAAPRPFCMGLGYAAMQLQTIHPQAHDIPMDLIATEDYVQRIHGP